MRTRTLLLPLLLLVLFPAAGSAQGEGGGGYDAGCGVLAICSGGHKVNGPSVGGVYYPTKTALSAFRRADVILVATM